MQGKTIHATDGETLKVSNQWAAECEQRGATVSSSTWAGTPTLGAVTLSGTIATALITQAASLYGYGHTGVNNYVTNTVTLSNGEVLVNKRLIKVV